MLTIGAKSNGFFNTLSLKGRLFTRHDLHIVMDVVTSQKKKPKAQDDLMVKRKAPTFKVNAYIIYMRNTP